MLETKAGLDFGKIFLNTKKGNFHLHFVCMAYHYKIFDIIIMTVTCIQSQVIQLLVYGHKRTDKTVTNQIYR